MDAKTVLEMVIAGMVDHPERVEVREVKGSNTSVLEIYVDREDVPKVVGKRHDTLNALHQVMRAWSGAQGRRHVVALVEPSAEGRSFEAAAG